jgi:4-amino-4-deoxy-L-arabinose transferase-like glycosyltransferase
MMIGKTAQDPLKYIYIAVIAAASLCVYANALLGEFVFDDLSMVVNNHWITDTQYLYDIFTTSFWTFSEEKELSKYYRPMVHLILLVEYHIFGLKSWGMHLGNLCLHTLNSVLVFGLAARLLRDDSEPAPGPPKGLLPCLCAGLVYATHPIHTEAVSWVSAVSEVSFSTFYLLALYFYVSTVQGREHTPERRGVLPPWTYALSVFFFFLGTLSKETAVTLPLVLVLYDYSRSGWGFVRNWRRYTGFIIAGLLYVVLRSMAIEGTVVQKHAELGTFHWLINTPYIIIKYMGKLILPTDLNAYYMISFYQAIGAGVVLYAVLVLIIVAAVVLSRRNTGVFTALALLFVPLLPALYLPGLMPMVFAERYVYLPSAGFALLIAALLAYILKTFGPRARTGIILATLITVVLYGAGTFQRNRVWHDGYTLWTDTVNKSPTNAAAYYNLGVATYGMGRFDESITAYSRALALYSKTSDLIDVYNNLGNSYARSGMLTEAMKSYESALELDPTSEFTRRNLLVIRRMILEREMR